MALSHDAQRVAAQSEPTTPVVEQVSTTPADEHLNMTYITILDPDNSNPNPRAPFKPEFPTNPDQSREQPTLTILCPTSPKPFTLPTHLLTTHSRLFAALSQSPSPPTPTETLHLNLDHEAFTVFARWLRGGAIHVPHGDQDGFATDVYLLMRAHAAGEALGAGVFADMVIDEIVGELTEEDKGEEQRYLYGGRRGRRRKQICKDSTSKARDLDILLQAAAAIWPAGSLGRDFLVDWYVHAPACGRYNLSAEAVVEIGDLDLAARCMVLGKERQMERELGMEVEPPYLVDPCRYHEHRRRGLPCYKRSEGSVWSELEYKMRCGVGVLEEDDSGLEEDEVPLGEYAACVDESMMFDVDGGGDHLSDVS